MKRSIDESAFWISYSDLATGLLLIFILLLTQMSKTKQVEQKRLIAENQKLVVQRQEFESRNQVLAQLREQVAHLLGVHSRLSGRLSSAVKHTNKELGKEIFQFSDGEVYVSDQEVTWFKSNSAKLLPTAQHQLRTFYLNLYDALLRDEEGSLKVESHLISMTIEGHTDPLPIKEQDGLWSLSSYNGSSRRKHNQDSNFQLGQQRAKAIIDLIHDAYVEEREGFDQTRPWYVFFAFAQASGRSWTRAYCQQESEVATRPLTPSQLIQSWPNPCAVVEQSSDANANRQSRRVTFSFELDTRGLLENLRQILDASDTSKE